MTPIALIRNQSQEEETYGTSQSPSPDQGYLPDNVDGRLPDADDDTLGVVFTSSTTTSRVANRIGIIEQ